MFIITATPVLVAEYRHKGRKWFECTVQNSADSTVLVEEYKHKGRKWFECTVQQTIYTGCEVQRSA